MEIRISAFFSNFAFNSMTVTSLFMKKYGGKSVKNKTRNN
ncbi:hypothetical protein HMPREF9141_1536 [Prevotella multiformis DSM 16608]|uniref:Uncharacterized protein n=1 Tax=Prevotella multiformis DSM 16608 TaxID=888743 RepID=F0F7G9_9BACT|nr:hypothetical protein HMPREF9141_1536 [Prevotella multiformis DSM 16608]